MKTLRLLFPAYILAALFFSAGCEKKYVPPGGISTYLIGKWQLAKTVIRADTLLPASGQQQVLQIGNDTEQNFLSIKQNGVETLRLFQESEAIDNDRYTVDVRYQNGKMLRYYLTQKYVNGSPNGVYQIQVTDFMKTYSEKADTVRYYYQRIQ